MVEKGGIRVENMSDETPETFQQAVDKVKEKVGKELLTDDDVLVLACAEIARTYSREEKGYT
jgi:hypothetical protein